MRNAKLDHQVEAWSALTKLVVGAVAVVLDKLTLLAHLDGTKCRYTRAQQQTHKYIATQK